MLIIGPNKKKLIRIQTINITTKVNIAIPNDNLCADLIASTVHIKLPIKDINPPSIGITPNTPGVYVNAIALRNPI